MADQQPETVKDTGEQEPQSLAEIIDSYEEQESEEEPETTSDEEPEPEPAPEPETPPKKWAGKFDKPEDLEQDYFRASQERNEYQRKLQEYEEKTKQAQPTAEEQPSPETIIENHANFLYTSKHLADCMDEFGDFKTEEEIQKIAAKRARREAQKDYETFNYYEQRLQAEKQMADPVYQQIERAKQEDPVIKGIFQKYPPDIARGIIADLMKGKATSPSPPPAPTTPSRPQATSQQMASAGRGGRTENREMLKSKTEIPSKFKGVFSEWGLKEENVSNVVKRTESRRKTR